MAAYDPSHIKLGPGSLYAAPLVSVEPISVTGGWPSAWIPLGYTDAGTEFDITPTVTDIDVEEEYWPVQSPITSYKGTVAFSLAEVTAANLQIALNNGLTPSAAAGGTETDGTLWVEPPDVQLEEHIMLGWDALPKGGQSGDPFMRLVVREVVQSGAMKIAFKKGNSSSNKLMFACSFNLIKPVGVEPFRFLFNDEELAA